MEAKHWLDFRSVLSADWLPMLRWAGIKRAILFIPDDTTPCQLAVGCGVWLLQYARGGQVRILQRLALENTIIALAP